ncbi:MAG: AAA family ATPase [Myxococcota bacterium]
MAVAPSEYVVRLDQLALRFDGQPDHGREDSALVRWTSGPLERVVSLAQALHIEAQACERPVSLGVVVCNPEGTAGADDASDRLALSLARLAEPGDTLLVHDSARPLPRSIVTESFGDLYPDPLDAPVHVMRLVDFVPTASRRPQSLGRDAEIARFTEIIEAIVERGRGAVLELTGKAGLGKSHLLAELRALASARGLRSHRTFHEPGAQRVEDSMVATLVRDLLGSYPWSDCALTSEHLRFLRDLIGLVPDAEDRRLLAAMSPEARDTGQRDALEALVVACAGHGPLLVEVEDLHWANSRDRRLIATLARGATMHPLLIATTSRTPAEIAWASDEVTVHRVVLGPLSLDDTHALAAILASSRRAPWMLTSSHYIDDDVLLSCATQSGGHPLLLEQLLAQARTPVGAPKSDASIAALVHERFARLEGDQQRALEFAAVLAERFEPAFIGVVLGRPWDPRPALESGLVRSEGPGLRFSHALVRDAIDATLSEVERRHRHLRIAELIDSAALRAYHLERAGERDAAQAYLRAAHEEEQAARYDVALSLIEQGLACARDDGDRLGLGLLQGRLCVDLGRSEEALKTYEEVVAQASTTTERCRGLVGMISALRLMSRLDDAEPLLAEAERLAIAHRLDAQLALVAYYRGCLLFSRGRVEACREQHERAAHHACRAGVSHTEALALSGLGDAYYAQTMFGDAAEVLDRCIALSRAHGYGRIEVANLPMLGTLRLLYNQVDEAVTLCEDAARLAVRVGNRRAEMFAQLTAGLVMSQAGQAEEGIARFIQAKQIADALETPVFRGLICAFESHLWSYTGQRQTAYARALEALEIARTAGMGLFGGVALGTRVRYARSEAERQQALDEGEALLATPCVSHNHLYFYYQTLETFLDAGQWERVEAHAVALDELTPRELVPFYALLTARARALVALGRAPGDGNARRAAREILARVEAAKLGALKPRLRAALR